MKLRQLATLGISLILFLILNGGRAPVAQAAGDPAAPEKAVLSPIWKPIIQQWSDEIALGAKNSGLDPDFIAAVINNESNGDANVVSRVGAVGLMGVMPAGPGLEWRPESEALLDPELNVRWGSAILSEVVRQSGGDIFAALAAYSGGWDQVGGRVPQEYAASVLDDYGRAVAMRVGIDPDVAASWTVAVAIRRGNVPTEPLLFGSRPLSGLYTFGEHIVYEYVDDDRNALYLVGYAVPLALIAPLPTAGANGYAMMDSQLWVRQGLVDSVKPDRVSTRLIMACLPSLSRLRGQASTRWFAPSDCPDWHR